MEAKVNQIVSSLIKITSEKKATWKESSTKGEYKILFDGATLTIGCFKDAYGKFYYSLKIFNNEGRAVVNESAYAGFPSSQPLIELFSAAQESSLRKNDTLSSIIEQLNQDIVGGNEERVFPF